MIYFDNAASTQVLDEVIEEMVLIMKNEFSNFDSNYTISLNLQKKINERKKILQKALGLNFKNFSFTSGGGEANNLALTSTIRVHKKGHFLISSIEHPTVFKTAFALKEEGYELDIIPVDSLGNVDLNFLENNIREDTILVSIIGVNNEVGTIQDMKKISEIIKSKNKNTYYHIDFVQGLNTVKFDFSTINVDLLSISSHKINGPKGIGALYVSDRVKFKKQTFGDNNSNLLVARTFPSELVIGFLKAIEVGLKNDTSHILNLKNYFIDKLNKLDKIYINSGENSSPAIINVSFLGIKAEVILNYLSSNNIYISTKSACSSNKEDSHILKAMNLPKERSESAVRISFSKFNTFEEIDKFFEILIPFLNMVYTIK